MIQNIAQDLLMDAVPLMKKHEGRINKITTAVTDLNDFEVATLAILLDNTEQVFNRYRRAKSLSDRTYSEDVGPFIKHAMDLVTTIFTTFDMRKIFSIQPLKQKYGALYHMNYTYSNTKGGVTAGDTIFDPQNAPKRDGLYASQFIEGETVALTFSTDHYTGSLAYYPITNPSGFALTITGGAAAGTYTVLAVASATSWTIKKDAGSTSVGTLNPVTGALSGLAATDIITGCTAAYTWNSEQASASLIPRVSISIGETLVQAYRRQLLFDVSLDTTYDFENQFGRDFMSEVQASIVREIQNEIAFDLLKRTYDGADGNGGETFAISTANPTDYSLFEKAQENFKVLSQMAMRLYKNLGRGKGNIIVCGADFIEYVEILGANVWARNAGADERGPYFAGRLLDRYDVYHNPGMDDAVFMMMYKGNEWYEAPFYLGTYLPVMASKYMLFPDMHGEQGFIAMDAPHYMYPKHVAKGTVAST